jgi:hypothetical protein
MPLKLGTCCRLIETVLISTTEGSTLSATERKAVWSPSAIRRASSGISKPGLSWALAVLEEMGVEQEKERNAKENPKITPRRTRLKKKKFFDAKVFIKFISLNSLEFKCPIKISLYYNGFMI